MESNIPTQRLNRKTVKWWNKDCTATRNQNRLYHHIWNVVADLVQAVYIKLPVNHIGVVVGKSGDHFNDNSI